MGAAEVVTIGPCQLWLGDCRAVLPTLGNVDAVVTDPPYGTDVPKDGYGRRGRQKRIEGDEDLSLLEDTAPEWRRLLRDDGWCLVFCSPKRRHEAESICRASALAVHGEIIWDKGMPGLGGGLRYQHETVLLAANGTPGGRDSLVSVLREPWGFNGVPRPHPHVKPLRLMRRLVTYATDAGATVLDPFMGSGTTGVACVRLGRRFIGIEKDAGHFKTAVKRIREAVNAEKSSLFPAFQD